MNLNKSIFPILLGVSLFSAGYMPTIYAKSPSSQEAVQGDTTDAKILGALIALNDDEIAAAKIAKKKASNSEVLHFATWMEEEHTQNLEQAQALIKKLNLTHITDATAEKLQHEGRVEGNKLKNTEKNSFDQAYMQDMVKGHQEALQLLTKLIAEAKDPLVKEYLLETEKHVQTHLNKAIAVEKAISH